MMSRLLIALALAALLPAQEGLRQTFERARMLEDQNSDLAQAIRLYGEVAQRGRGERPLAARALFRQGLLYRRLGRNVDAARCWRTLIAEFPEEKDLVQQARTKLNASAPRMNGIVNRRVFEGEFGAPSPDGRTMLFTDSTTGNLALRDLQTGEQRALTHKKEKWNESMAQALGAVFSPRGNTVAYQWMNHDGSVELRSVSIDGSHDVLLLKDPGFSCEPLDWSPDGSRILVRLRSRDHLTSLAYVPARGGNAVLLTPAKTTTPGTAVFAADSQGVFYSLLQEDEQGEDIYFRAPDGADHPVIRHPAHDYILGMSPSRHNLLFFSDRLAAGSIWSLNVQAGPPFPDPVLARENTGIVQPLGITKSGALFYTVPTGTLDIYTAEVDPASGAVLSPPKAVVSRYTGRNVYPTWSPDGQLLLFRTQNNNFAIYQPQTGLTRQIEPQIARCKLPQWFPDGRSLFAYCAGASGPAGHYRIDAQTGTASLVFPIDLTDSDFEGAWSPDGRYFFNRPKDWRKGIYRIDAQTRETRVLYAPPAGVSIGLENLAPSPDGKLLAFHAVQQPVADSSLMLMDVEGRSVRPLLTIHKPERFAFGAFAWTPDSRAILAVRGVDDKTEVWKVPIDGSSPIRLGLRMPRMTMLRLNPDGRTISFHAGEVQAEVWVVEGFLPPERM